MARVSGMASGIADTGAAGPPSCTRPSVASVSPRRQAPGTAGRRMRRVALLMAALAATWLAPPAFAGFDEGAVAYERGDYKTAYREFLEAAKQGDVLAQGVLSMMYYEGKGVPRDYAEAARWLRQAAEQGDPGAQNRLGEMYAEGEGVSRDYVEATRWYRQAAEQGNAVAQNNLGRMYAEGKGVPQDFVEAARWLRQAAEQSNAVAQHNLGGMYANGVGVPRDYVEAYKWFSLAAAAGQFFKLAAQSLNALEKRMTAAQVAEAQARARNWQREFDAKSPESGGAP